MPLLISIDDPGALSRRELLALSNMLRELADARVAGAPPALDPADNPAAGATGAGSVTYAAMPDAAEVFSSCPSTAGAAAASTAPAAPTPGQTEAPPPFAATIPAPPPAPVAPTAAVPAPPGPGPALDVDVTGLPWDSRIHAGERQKNKDGSWRTRRGVDKALVVQVEQELRAALAHNAPKPPAAPVATPTPLPLPPTTTATAAPDPAGPPHMALVQRLMLAIAENKLTPEEMGSVLAGHGVAGLPVLASMPHLIPAVTAAFDKLLGAAS